jgi:hypothetical protein
MKIFNGETIGENTRKKQYNQLKSTEKIWPLVIWMGQSTRRAHPIVKAAVCLFGHFVQRATRPTKNRAPVRLSRLIKQTNQI